MFAFKLSTIAILAIYGPAVLAAPAQEAAPDTSKDFMAGVDTSNWVSVDFYGKTIHYNPAVFNDTASTSGTSKPRSLDTVLAKRATCNADCCGGSSFGGTAAPWANVGDCAAIRDWAYAQNRYFIVWGNTPDYHGLVFAGTCAFGAGTRNVYQTYLGSSDMGDLTRDGINMFQGNGLVGAAGSMACCNEQGCNGSGGQGPSNVFWKLQCNGC